MSYTFSSLSDADFEDLSRDLIGKHLGIRFEAFGPGPDGGIDGRHAATDAETILQAKHYTASRFPALLRAMRRERSKIDELAPSRYILSTSRDITPHSKNLLADAIGPTLQSTGDILGRGDLNSLLRRFPEIEKAHIKLWLSGSAVLERVIRSGVFNFTAASRAEVEAKVRVYAPNPSFKEARDRLEIQHVLIISGPPGVGKTTLAEMLAYAYIGEEWEFVAIRSLEDGFDSIVDAKKQIFFFDDFLGTVALDARALATKDSELAKFIKRVRRTANARFILTTRAYIFEEAKRVSEHLADERVDVSKYVLDVGVYTRRIKARILYNHLVVAETPKKYVRALIKSGLLAEIIDHPNYNPRIIEWMTDVLRIGNVTPKAYPALFIASLNDPSRIWDTAFRTHITKKCQHLLYALFFSSEHGVEVDDLRAAFDPLHAILCNKYGHAYDPMDFHEAVKVLEGSFINLAGRTVSFINPSVRDYLSAYTLDQTLLADFPPAAPTAKWAETLYDHFLRLDGVTESETAILAGQFLPLAERLDQVPVWKRTKSNARSVRAHDTPQGGRVELLARWWRASGILSFIDIATAIATRPLGGFSPWFDGTTLIATLVDLVERDEGDGTEALRAALAGQIVSLLDNGMAPDEIDKFADAIEARRDLLPAELGQALDRALDAMITDMPSLVADIDSESTLDDHRRAVERISTTRSIDPVIVRRALSAIEERTREVQERTSEADEPSFSGSMPRERDQFEDSDLMNLFAPLLAR